MSRPGTPRSRSRSKRSTTNLSDLRLAPLSAKFAEPVSDRPKTPKSPYDETPDAYFARQHPSYLEGKSAPSTPGILSRSSSRRSFGAGLSRKSEVYEPEDADDEVNYTYAAGPARNLTGERAEYGSGQVPKAKSEAALFAGAKHHGRSLSGQGIPLSRRSKHPSGRRSGGVTPKNEYDLRNESWLTHTGATASALVQQDKGLSWLASRAQSTSGVAESEDDDDDQYEEMAALSASTAQLQLSEFDGGSPVSTRASRWGSRYGSRSASRHASRINSPVGTRTPRRGDPAGYFDDLQLTSNDVGFVKPSSVVDEDDDEQEVDRLSTANSFGLGGIVDSLMNFRLFKVEEGQETTADEATDDETPEQAKERLAAEMKRKREAKAKLTQPPPAPRGDGEQGEVGGWTDAAWLLSVASKAMF